MAPPASRRRLANVRGRRGGGPNQPNLGTTSRVSSNIQWGEDQRRDISKTMFLELNRTGDIKAYVSSVSDKEATDETQVAVTLRYLFKYNLLPIINRELLKDREESLDLRNEGNSYFRKKEYEVALLLYSWCIAAAPYEEDSEELALGFANRSAVYYEVGDYEACLRDIEQALMFNYPDRLKSKVLVRRDKCYKILGRKDENSSSAQREPSTSSYASKTLPQKAFGQHTNIPCASECVDIAYNPRVGRYMVANRDIDPGDVLFVEEPYASVLDTDCTFTHCNNCAERSDAMLPCKRCDQVMYCSETCREASWKSYHRIECKLQAALMRLDVGSETPSTLLALRVLLISCSKNNGIFGLFKLHKELNHTMRHKNNIKGFNADGKYLSTDYHQINYLFRNLERKDGDYILNKTIAAACILNGLQTYTDLFSVEPQGNTKSLSNVCSFTGGLLFKLIQIINNNVYIATDFVREADAEFKDVEIAWGLYSTLSLVNHSCNSSACSSFHNGAVQVVIAKQPIRKGEEVTMSYSYNYEDVPYMIRREDLREGYFFDCECVACVNKWPTSEYLELMEDPTFVCKSCRIPLPKTKDSQIVNCPRCNTEYGVSLMHAQAIQLRDRVTDIYEESDQISNPKYLSELASIIKTLDTLLLNPNLLMNKCLDYLRQSMKTSGNFVYEEYTDNDLEAEPTNRTPPSNMKASASSLLESFALDE